MKEAIKKKVFKMVWLALMAAGMAVVGGAEMAAQTGGGGNDALYVLPEGVQTRWASAENWKGEKGAAAQKNASIDKAKDMFPKLRIPVIDGDIKLVYEPDPDHPNSWMVNDHCLIRDEKGMIHFFGIENPFPTTTQALEWLKADLQPSERPFIQTLHRLMHGHLYREGTHFRIGHAVANNIWGPWQRLPAALDGGDKKTGHGSPFVVRYENKYWMLEPCEHRHLYERQFNGMDSCQRRDSMG